MRTVDMNKIRSRVGDEPCADCGEPSETFMLNERTVYVCLGCWGERHSARAAELKADRAKQVTATKRFHAKMARVFADLGDEENAEAARCHASR